jgi:hypothetical protein
MHRETAALADQAVDETEYEEARERIMERLERLREREAGNGVETKAARDARALIAWGLARR